MSLPRREAFLADLLRLCRSHNAAITSCGCDDGIRVAFDGGEDASLYGVKADGLRAEGHTAYYGGETMTVSIDETVVVHIAPETPES